MDNYELEDKILHFCLLRSKENRFSEITKPLYKDERILGIIKELADYEKNPSYRQNLLDHLELFKEYQIYGISVLNYFTSILEIESCFVQFAFGFDDFPKREQYLLSFPFLIERRSIEIITNYIERDKVLSNRIASRLFRNLLKACGIIGIEEAFIEFATPDEKYIDAVNSLFRRDTLTDIMYFLGEYGGLITSPQMRNVFHYLQAQFEKDDSKRSKIIALWDIISPHQSEKREIWFWE